MKQLIEYKSIVVTLRYEIKQHYRVREIKLSHLYDRSK